MKLHVIATGSSGNAYLLSNERESLLIEAGVQINTITKALDYNLSKLVGCIVSHNHSDHCVGVPKLLKSGVEVYASEDCHNAMKTNGHHSAKIAIENVPFHLGGFKIKGFAVKHDEKVHGSFGYLIHHPETGNVLFMTDLYYTKYFFKGLNNIIIEANYSEEIMNSLPDYRYKRMLDDRVIASHMSLETCRETLKANDLTAVNNIVFVHLSNRNADHLLFQQEIQAATGKSVIVAESGMVIENFNIKPF